MWKLLRIRNFWNNQNQVYLKPDYKKRKVLINEKVFPYLSSSKEELNHRQNL